MGKNKIVVDHKGIGQRMQKERKKLELSREKFAEIIGLSEYYVGQLERGERQMSLPVLIKISHCLHLSLDYLIFGKDNDHSYQVYDNHSIVAETFDGYQDPELNFLLQKCAPKEIA